MNMKEKLMLYQLLYLEKDLPEYNLKAGCEAYIVERLKDKRNNSGYALEFFNENQLYVLR